MSIRHRIRNFAGTKDQLIEALIEEIESNESELLTLKLHHSGCIASPATTLPTSIVSAIEGQVGLLQP